MTREGFFQKIVALVFTCLIKPIAYLFKDEEDEVLEINEYYLKFQVEQGPERYNYYFTIRTPNEIRSELKKFMKLN